MWGMRSCSLVPRHRDIFNIYSQLACSVEKLRIGPGNEAKKLYVCVCVCMCVCVCA